jgi:two-component system, chemotaxis family, sensor kinase CheA
MNEIIREFLLETNENLAQLDLDLVTLEKDPKEKETLARVFRTLHTVKGTAGFLGLPKLQAVAHAAETLLSRLRAGELDFNAAIATGLLAVVDAVRTILAGLEASESEGPAEYGELIQTLDRLTRGEVAPSPPAPVVRPAPTPPPPVAKAAPVLPAPASPTPPVRAEIGYAATVVAEAAPRSVPATTQSIVEPSGLAPSEPRAPAIADTSLRVDVGLLDKLMTLVGELVLARNQILQFSAAQEDAPFLATVQRLNLLTTELQAGVMKTRMQPIGNIWTKFPRIVRDLAVACAKQVRIDMDGQETELDKTIIEAIRDPLTHMVRNAVDHGIELPAERVARGKVSEGRLLLKAAHEGGKVIIEIADDGGGIDPQRVKDKAVRLNLLTPEQAVKMSDRELINLVFLPGFSTTDRVTHFSGRGVGMDVVKTNIEKIGGSVDIESQLGQGTTVKMKIPLTLAIIPALTVTAGGDRYAIPQVSLLELVRLDGERARKGIEMIHGAPVYRLRGNLLPIVYLDQQLQIEANRPAGGEINVIVLQADDRPFGLVVDDIHDTEEIVVKPLQKQLKGVTVFSGATIMGDGKVALILDVLGLAQRSGVLSGARERARADKVVPTELAGDRHTVLLFAAPGGGRMAIPLALVARLEEFPRSAIERVGRQTVVQYRDDILPLIHVSRILNSRPKTKSPDGTSSKSETVPVVVYAGHGKSVGLVVGRILDIVEATIVTRSQANRPGVLFSAVVQDRVTEFLDVEGIIRIADPNFFAAAAAQAGV